MAKKKAEKKVGGNSPRINFRITKEMADALDKRSGGRGKLSAMARAILAEALGMTDDAKRIKQGRPTISDNS